jgi:two-component sensor histidine kinase
MAVDVRLSPGPRAPAEARETVGQALRALDPNTLGTLCLLVSELVTNSVRHASISTEEAIDLSVRRQPGRIRVSVTDPGGGFTPAPPDHDIRSGWGLFLVDRLADRWGVTSDGQTRVWFEVDH